MKHRLYTEQVPSEFSRYRRDLRALMRIAVPLAFAELGWMSMSVVDNIMVGHLPDSAVAIGAASLGSALFYSFAIFGIGLMSGLDTLVSHAFGAGDWPAAHRSLASGLALAALAAPLLMAGVVLSDPLLAIVGVTSAVRDRAIAFSHILVWSLPLLLVYTTFRRYLQGIHYVKPVTMALITSNLVNLLGNWILIYGHWGMPALGIRGSALSTVVARIYLAGFLLEAVRRRDPAALLGIAWDRAQLARLIRLGLPAAITIGLEVAVFNAATAIAGTLDAVSLAAHTIALNAASVTYMVPLGISSAAAVSVGRAIGAGDRPAAARAGWTALALATLFEIASALGFLLLPGPIARFYTRDPAVVALTAVLFAIAAVFQLFDGLQTVATGALRGLGNTRTAMVWNLAGYWGIGLPLGCWLCFRMGWGAAGLWDGLCAALIIVGLGLLGVWKKQTGT